MSDRPEYCERVDCPNYGLDSGCKIAPFINEKQSMQPREPLQSSFDWDKFDKLRPQAIIGLCNHQSKP